VNLILAEVLGVKPGLQHYPTVFEYTGEVVVDVFENLRVASAGIIVAHDYVTLNLNLCRVPYTDAVFATLAILANLVKPDTGEPVSLVKDDVGKLNNNVLAILVADVDGLALKVIFHGSTY
jgi:hypothetical protein